MKDYVFKTVPFDHQRKVFEETKDLESYAIFWEMGCGKTKLAIDVAAYNYERGRVDAILVIAPNGVHANWADNELPAHMPDRTNWECFTYHSKKAGTKLHQRGCSRIQARDGLSILSMSYSACITPKGKSVLAAFLKKRKVFMILDESARIKTPSAKRTRSLVIAGKGAVMKRILTGTPIANGPFDIYSQLRFLDPDFWRPHQLHPFTVFKSYFGVFTKMKGPGGREFPLLLNYRRLEELSKVMSGVGSRLTKDEVLDLPPKLYSTYKFDLSSEQQRLYAELQANLWAELDGEEITAPLALVRMLRFQQIVNGYIGVDDKDGLVPIPGPNPRMDLFKEIIEDIPHSAIIWCRFTRDLELVANHLGENCVTYYGATSPEDRATAINRFQDGEVRFFVGNPQAAGEGLTLHRARTVVYYSNSFKLTERLQSEDRAHRIGQTHPVQYIDIAARRTIDEHIVKALVKKQDIARIITGDKLKEWI